MRRTEPTQEKQIMALPATSTRPRIYGHRGSRHRAPDNTLDSFHLALEEGAAGFETDVRQLVDGKLVLFQPELIDGRRPESLSLEELASLVTGLARPAELNEFRSLRAEIIVEIKGSGFAQQLVEEIRGLPGLVLSSFDHRVVAELARIRETSSTEFRVGAIVSGRLLDGARYVSELGADWFLPAGSFVDGELVAEFTAKGIRVVPWVLNHPHQWKVARDAGCHGFITDDPMTAAGWLDKSEGGTSA